MKRNYYLHTVSLACLVSLISCAPIEKNTAASTPTLKQETIINNALQVQAQQAFKAGNYQQSAELYEKLLNQTPNNQDSLFYYAESLRISGNTAKASEQYNQILQSDPNNLSAIEGSGLCQLQNGDLAGALDKFNIVITKDVSRWRTINAIGVIHSIQGKNADAEQYYNMALQISHNNPSVINNMAMGIAFSGDTKRGISLLNSAIASMQVNDIKKQRLENNLALLYGISGQMNEAEKILRKNLPEPAVYNNLGFYAKLAENKTLAWQYLSKAIESSPVYYDKAENNISTLGNASATVENKALEQTDITKTESAKVWRGKYKLPLPMLRPSNS